MNIAVIFAGGTGQRMNTKTKPKQFLELYDKPILVYTIEHFQNHPDIDGIVVVCLKEWIEYCKKLIKTFHLDKVSAVVPGGSSAKESIYYGLVKAKELYPEGSIVLIHDGVRPLIDNTTIQNCISCVKGHGSAIVASPATETIVKEDNTQQIDEIFDRSRCQLVKAPQGFYLADILAAQEKAKEEDNKQFIDSASLMSWAGHSLYTVEGKSENIKNHDLWRFLYV